MAKIHELPLPTPAAVGSAVQIVESGELMIRLRAETEASVLEVYGELELANASTLERELRVLEEGLGPRTIVIDLSGLDFIDTTGLSTLVAAQRRAENGGWALGLLRPTGQVSRILELTGLTDELPFLD
jgi:anti-sigma B factor antagonist